MFEQLEEKPQVKTERPPPLQPSKMFEQLEEKPQVKTEKLPAEVRFDSNSLMWVKYQELIKLAALLPATVYMFKLTQHLLLLVKSSCI